MFVQYVVGTQLTTLSQQNVHCYSSDICILLPFNMRYYYMVQTTMHHHHHLHHQELSRVMRRIRTFRSTTDRIYDIGPIILHYNTEWRKKNASFQIIVTFLSSI